MSARGVKKRGRPPKVAIGDRPKKFQYHLMKKPKYLLNQGKGTDSQLSTPTASRASSPQGSEGSRRSSTRIRGGHRAGRRGAISGSQYQRRGYNPNAAETHDSEYHYGSDFGDESSDKSEAEDELHLSRSDSEDSIAVDDPSSDSDFSLSSYSTLSGTPRRPGVSYVGRAPSPEPLWLQNIELPPLVLPQSSEDLLVPKENVMQTLSVYEVLRHFRYLVRLSPFRLEDFCAAIICEDQSNLLAEIHIMLLKAVFREEDSQQTHFGPLDQKDSINISVYLIDYITWPEILRMYVESDKGFDAEVLNILSNSEYPFCPVEDRLKVLQYLTDQFLITNPVREDLLTEAHMHDDHCRVCHKLGNLLCCETCPAVFHLECVDPPLTDVPTEEWQCSICKSHRVSGVFDCVLSSEKEGQLCRQEHLGFDRHGRKYWFLTRRLFVESEDSEVWYYSTPTQLQEVLDVLDHTSMEASLCRELADFKDEIVRQMELTEKLTNQAKGNKKSYLDAETERKERLEKKAMEEEEDRKEKERQAAEDMVAKMHEEPSGNGAGEQSADPDKMEVDSTSTTVEKTVTTTNSSQNQQTSTETQSTVSTSLVSTPRTVMAEELKKRIIGDVDKTDSGDNSRMTRLKTSQIANGTYLFKLGMENQYKNYVNQFTTNVIALNKPQRNEERDKKRHLSHKFSLTTASEYKWIGALNGSRSLMVNTLRQTMLQMEQSIPVPFMHPNWSLLRKPWVSAVGACINARDFARALIVLQACIKPVVFASVWHEQLGHIKLYRVTAAEREERKKIEKREKKEREEEEERNKITCNFVKYTLGIKHQVWKQKGEEYRVHGQWGWVWMTSNRKVRNINSATLGLLSGPQKMMVQIKDGTVLKILAVDLNSYKYLTTMFTKENEVKTDKETGMVEQENTEVKKEDDVPPTLKNLRVVPLVTEFEEIDVSKALTTSSRLLFPKIAKKSRLDDFLNRRTHLKVLEERKAAIQANQSNSQLPANPEIKQNEEDINVDVENEDSEFDITNLSKQLPNMTTNTSMSREMIITIAKKIQSLRLQYHTISKINKNFQCYSKSCDMDSTTLTYSEKSNCYSPMCMQRAKMRHELVTLLRKVNNQSVANYITKKNTVLPSVKKPSILEMKLTGKQIESPEDKINAIRKDLESAVASATNYVEDMKANNVFVPKKETIEDVKPELKTEIKTEAMSVDVETDIKPESQTDVKSEAVEDTEDKSLNMEDMTAEDIKEMIMGGSKKKANKTASKTSAAVAATVTSPPKESTSETKTVNVTNTSSAVTYCAQENRRFRLTKTIRREEKAIKTERAADGTEKVYSAVSTEGKLYLKKVSLNVNDKRKKRTPVKYPLCSTFQTKRGQRSLLILPQHEVRKLGRKAGRFQVSGFHHLAKPNQCVWPYPCPRPLFKTCWLYRTVGLKSLTAAALQLRILWACLRWDDMQMKPLTTDGKHQITTETEIMTLELLKHRHIGQFLERTQYLRRKIVIPLELPKTIREVTSIRSGLRKRKRPESPQSTEPQFTEEWVEEDKLELWEIKLYGERLERTNAQVITRSRTGNLPPSRIVDGQTISAAGSIKSVDTVSNKATSEEIKEKMEQQLRIQRLAHQQKRALEMKQGTLVKMVTNTAQIGPDGTLKIVGKVQGPQSINNNTKSTLTSLLTANSNTTGGNKTLIGTRRILMTKNADGTSRVLAPPTAILPKTMQQNNPSIIKLQGPGGTSVQSITSAQLSNAVSSGTITKAGGDGPQRVQIIRNADGKIHVRGLMPGQQLVQMSDGKLHVLSTSQLQNILSPNSKPIAKGIATSTTVTANLTPTKTVVQNAAPKPTVSTPVQQKPTMIRQQVINNTPTLQKALSQGQQQQHQQQQQQQQQQQSVASPFVNNLPTAQVVTGPSGNVSQIVVSDPELAQQIASGKVHIATVNGQQVLIRPTGNNQAQIVAHLNPSPVVQQIPVQQTVMNQGQTMSPQQGTITNQIQQVQQQISQQQTQGIQQQQQQVLQPVQQQIQQPIAPKPNTIAEQQLTPTKASNPTIQQSGTPETELNTNHTQQSVEESLLAGQPPGTVIKCVTAQVIQTAQGPRIVLQGLTGTDFTQDQLALVQQQVKQQLLQAQASTGKQGVLGPTKIYLAVQPVQPNNKVTQEIKSPGNEAVPLQGVPAAVTHLQPPPLTPVQTTPRPSVTPKKLAPLQPTTIPNMSQTNAESTEDVLNPVVVNGQKTQLTNEQNAPSVVPPVSTEPGEQPSKQSQNKFVITREYIQHKIEEKLLQLQRYQEQQLKHEPNTPTENTVVHAPVVQAAPRIAPVRKRPLSCSKSNDDDEWIVDTPKRKVITKIEVKPKEDIKYESPEEISPNSSRNRTNKLQEEKRKTAAARSKNQVTLFRQKELLKKEILKKRATLEKDFQIDIQKELSAELANRTKAERSKQDEVRTGSSKRKSIPTATTTLAAHASKTTGRPKKQAKSSSQAMTSPNLPRSGGGGGKKEKLYCLCRTPYDETKFYVGCDLCNNWFHGDCVGITEEMSKSLSEFVCTECRHARDTQELYCLCKQPYDESQFYICCDKCQDWFHGRCVGILQSEADNIDEYVCPNCSQHKSSVNVALSRNLAQRDFDGLRKLIKQIQSHKNAWPFLEPVDPNEAPDYYKIIREPMDLQTIENKINDRLYTKLSDFIGDMTKVFDNCRYYNPKESQFFKCAESLEGYFVNKIKFLREKLFDTHV